MRLRWSLPVGLFLLAPYVGEFLLGNQPITAFPYVALLAPMYGGGALLIREVARRTGIGWRGIILLAAAYALVEEGPIDQMLFNPAYVGLDSFVGLAPIPGLDISGSLLQGTLTLHTVWSICVPIAIVEAFDREEPRPWLGKVGLTVAAVVFVLGSALLWFMQYSEFRFVGSLLQNGVIVALVVVLIALAFRLPRTQAQTSEREAPRPLRVGLVAFALTGLYWASDRFVAELVDPWISILCWAILAAGSVVLLVRASRRTGWGPAHRLAVAGGCLLTYVWAGFLHASYLDVPREISLIGNVVFGTGAVVLLALAVLTQRRHSRAPVAA